MKIRILFSLLTLVLLLSLTACINISPNNQQPNKQHSQELAQNTKDSQPIPNEISNSDSTNSQETNKSSQEQPSAVPDVSSDTKLSKDEAAQIALSHAGLAAEEVSYLHVESDFDDGIHKYDVQFFHDTFEYDYEIESKSGAILSFEKDRD